MLLRAYAIDAMQLALLCLGEIGKRTDLSSHSTLLATVTRGFASDEEEMLRLEQGARGA